MPWQLTSPIDVGDLDSAAYDQVRITRLVHDSVRAIIQLDIEYGRTMDNAWVTGLLPVGKKTSFHMEGAEYLALVQHVSNDGELTYNAVKRGLYEHLASKGIIAEGVLV